MRTYHIYPQGFAPNDLLILRSLLSLAASQLCERWEVIADQDNIDVRLVMPTAKDLAEGNTWVKGKFNVRVDTRHLQKSADSTEWILQFPMRTEALVKVLNRIGNAAEENARVERILRGNWARTA
jgi:hypothetical protein